MKPTSVDDCIARYGPVCAAFNGGLIWKQANTWIRACAVPDQIVMRNYLGKQVRWIFANTDIHAALEAAFKNLIACGAHMEIISFDGCFHVRWVRGRPGVPSFHSWGLAVDFNAKSNPLGSAGTWSPAFIQSMEDAGFFWGGKFKGRSDPMHFEWIDRDTLKSGALC